MIKPVFNALAVWMIATSASASCFDDFPNIRSEWIEPFGQIVWSPLVETSLIERWLNQRAFIEIEVTSPESDRFWVRGQCLAQITPLDSSNQAWLVGSAFGQPLFDALEIPDVSA